MLDDFKIQFSDLLKTLSSFLWKNTIGRIAILLTVIGFLQSLGIWELIFAWFVRTFTGLVIIFTNLYYGVPGYIWFIISVALISLVVTSIRQNLYLGIVSGVFYDNFTKGLSKWEFGGEGWKVEEEEGKPVLSVSESPDGGITKRGFSWSDYEFTFDTKVIKDSSGWIIRAENRNKYFMIQLNLSNISEPKLRPHLRLNDQDYPWIALETYSVNLNSLGLKQPIKLLNWIKVKIIVRSNEIDVFLNNEHALHFFLPDPFRFEKQETIQTGSEKESSAKLKRDVVVVSYPVGRVGFRCSGYHEHAHFKDVRVKPLLW